MSHPAGGRRDAGGWFTVPVVEGSSGAVDGDGERKGPRRRVREISEQALRLRIHREHGQIRRQHDDAGRFRRTVLGTGRKGSRTLQDREPQTRGDVRYESSQRRGLRRGETQPPILAVETEVAPAVVVDDQRGP